MATKLTITIQKKLLTDKRDLSVAADEVRHQLALFEDAPCHVQQDFDAAEAFLWERGVLVHVDTHDPVEEARRALEDIVEVSERVEGLMGHPEFVSALQQCRVVERRLRDLFGD